MSSCHTAGRRSSTSQRDGDAPGRTHEGIDRVHDARPVASASLQQGSPPRVEMDALRNLRRDGADPDAAAAARHCFADRSRSPDSVAQPPCGPRADVSPRSPRSTCCRGRTACRSRPRPGNRRMRTLGGCPRRRQIAIGDWTRGGMVRDTAPSRRRGSPCRVLKEARRVTTPAAGLPSCTDLMVATSCSDRIGCCIAFRGAQGLRRRRREPEPRAALRGTESELRLTAGIRRIQAAVYRPAAPCRLRRFPQSARCRQ